jgi:acetyl-CoA acetyltransferase
VTPGAAITGIGWTKYSRESGTTVTNLALEACQKAIADAGVDVEDVQSIICFGLDDSVHPQAIATGLGLPRIDHYLNIYGGGQVCCATLAYAEMLIESGRTEHVLVFRALNGRSGPRLGGTGMEDHFSRGTGEAQFTFPFGWISFPQYIALSARRHMIQYGTTSEAFAEVALTARENAMLNDRAMMRKPMTIDDYYGSRMLADPLRLFDICLESDGATALLVSRADIAEGLAHPVVRILSAVQGGGPRPGYGFDGYFEYENHGELYGKYVSEPLWGRAGVTPDDVDVASIYDCFTYSVLAQLEGLGFCEAGGSADFVKDGRIRRDGALPINTNGGMLSEAYVHGINGIAEVVSQLRGDAGDRQVPDASIGLATGFGTTTGCAAVLARV